MRPAYKALLETSDMQADVFCKAIPQADLPISAKYHGPEEIPFPYRGNPFEHWPHAIAVWYRRWKRRLSPLPVAPFFDRFVQSQIDINGITAPVTIINGALDPARTLADDARFVADHSTSVRPVTCTVLEGTLHAFLFDHTWGMAQDTLCAALSEHDPSTASLSVQSDTEVNIVRTAFADRILHPEPETPVKRETLLREFDSLPVPDQLATIRIIFEYILPTRTNNSQPDHLLHNRGYGMLEKTHIRIIVRLIKHFLQTPHGKRETALRQLFTAYTETRR